LPLCVSFLHLSLSLSRLVGGVSVLFSHSHTHTHTHTGWGSVPDQTQRSLSLSLSLSLFLSLSLAPPPRAPARGGAEGRRKGDTARGEAEGSCLSMLMSLSGSV